MAWLTLCVGNELFHLLVQCWLSFIRLSTAKTLGRKKEGKGEARETCVIRPKPFCIIYIETRASSFGVSKAEFQKCPLLANQHSLNICPILLSLSFSPKHWIRLQPKLIDVSQGTPIILSKQTTQKSICHSPKRTQNEMGRNQTSTTRWSFQKDNRMKRGKNRAFSSLFWLFRIALYVFRSLRAFK